MFCDEALNAVEAIAGGELTPDGRIAAHLQTCPNCAAALESARRLDDLLRVRPVPSPPAQFTTRTMALLRRRRWRTEQFLDVGFNVALGLVALTLVAASWLFLNRSGLASVSNDAVNLLGSGVVAVARRIAPSVPLYAGATALVLTALGIWWWAERDATF